MAKLAGQGGQDGQGKGPGGSLVLKLRDVEEGWLAGQRPEPKLVADDVGVRHGWRDPAGYGARRRESGDTNGKNRPGAAGSRRETQRTTGINHQGHEGRGRSNHRWRRWAQMNDGRPAAAGTWRRE